MLRTYNRQMAMLLEKKVSNAKVTFPLFSHTNLHQYVLLTAGTDLTLFIVWEQCFHDHPHHSQHQQPPVRPLVYRDGGRRRLSQ